MNLGSPAPSYSVQDQAQMRRQLTQAEQANRKIGQDVDVGAQKLILAAPNGSRWRVTVANDGALSATAL